MAEIIQKDGTWTFDGDALRLTPGREKNVSLLRNTLGELTVPLGALAGISFEQGKKAGRLRLRLRDGADPLLQATGGKLAEPNDPYQLTVESDRYGVAEYIVDEIRDALLLDQVWPTRSTAICSPAPPCRCPSPCGDGTASFDGERVRLEWNWKTEDSKSAHAAPAPSPSATSPPSSGTPRSAWRTATSASPSAVRRHRPRRSTTPTPSNSGASGRTR